MSEMEENAIFIRCKLIFSYAATNAFPLSFPKFLPFLVIYFINKVNWLLVPNRRVLHFAASVLPGTRQASCTLLRWMLETFISNILSVVWKRIFTGSNWVTFPCNSVKVFSFKKTKRNNWKPHVFGMCLLICKF